MDADRIADRPVADRGAGDAVTAIEFSPFRDADGRPRRQRAATTDPVLGETAPQLTAYFAGELRSSTCRSAPQGSDFQRRVWAQLATIPYGETASYGEIAHRLGMTNAASPGGRAGQRPQPDADRHPVPPGDRRDGTLTGYAGGVERKQTLLELEQDALF